MADPTGKGGSGGGGNSGPLNDPLHFGNLDPNAVAWAKIAKIAELAKTHPDWVQVDATHWKTPGGIVHELLADKDGNPVFGGAWTAAASKAYLAGNSGGGGGSGSSGSGSSGGGSSAPKGPTAAQVKAAGPYYGFNTPEDAQNFANQISSATPEQLAQLQQIAQQTAAKKVASATGQPVSTAGPYYGFNSPEEAQAFAQQIQTATPEQLAALQSLAARSNASGTDPALLAYQTQQDQATLDLQYAKLSSDEKIAAQQLAYQYMNAGLDANAARQQALATLIANRNSQAVNLASTSSNAAAQAAQFAANPRDAVADIQYRNALGMTATPYGSTANPAFGQYQTALDDKFQQMFGPAAQDLENARKFLQQPIPNEYLQPVQVSAPAANPSTYTAPKLGIPEQPQQTPPMQMQPSPQPQAPVSKQNKQQADMIRAYAAYHPEDQGAQWKAAWLDFHPDEAIPFAKGGTVGVTPSSYMPTSLWNLAWARRGNQLMNARRGSQYYDPQFDLNGDGVINVADQAIRAHAAVQVNPNAPVRIGRGDQLAGGVAGPQGVPNDFPLPMRGIPAPQTPPNDFPMPMRGIPAPQGIPNDFPFTPKQMQPQTPPNDMGIPNNRAKPNAFPGFIGPLNFPANFGHFAEGGAIGQTTDGFRPASSSGGTNMNIHELAFVVGKSGHVYATLGENGYPEQLKITPTAEGKKYAQEQDKKQKSQEKRNQYMMKAFAEGGTLDVNASDFITQLRKQLSMLDPQAQAQPGQDLPDPRLLSAGVYNRMQTDPDLAAYIHAAYSKYGISDNALDSTLGQFRPQGLAQVSYGYR